MKQKLTKTDYMKQYYLEHKEKMRGQVIAKLHEKFDVGAFVQKLNNGSCVRIPKKIITQHNIVKNELEFYEQLVAE